MKETNKKNTSKTKSRKKQGPRSAGLLAGLFRTSQDLLQLILLIIMGIMLISFVFHLFNFNRDAEYENSVIDSNIKAINRFDFSNVPTIEEELEEIELAKESKSSSTTDKAAFQKAFRGNIILGDSVTEGISAYGFLPSDIVFSKIGASLASSGDLFTQAASTYPKNAFFAMGMNDMGNYRDNVDGFITEYEKYLKKFKKTSPKTKIFICAVSRPSDAAISKKSWLGNSEKYNKKIKEMCKKNKFTYIDITSIFRDHPDFYEGDGIHASPSYYPYWLKIMAKAADLDLRS